jgi:hypothetical protein
MWLEHLVARSSLGSRVAPWQVPHPAANFRNIQGRHPAVNTFDGPVANFLRESSRRARKQAEKHYFAAVTDSASIVIFPSAVVTLPFTSTIFDANGTSFAFLSSANLPVNV